MKPKISDDEVNIEPINIERISLNEATFHPHSFADPDGRLFRWNGQLLRGISSEWAPFVRGLFQDGVVQDLVEEGLIVDSELTSLEIDSYEMVVRHRIVPFVSYPNEWCAAMLKDAALTVVDLLMALAQRELTLKDANLWNVLFDAYKPVHVDLTSITPLKPEETKWSRYDSFCRFCLHPLILMAHHQAQIARLLMCEDKGVLKSDLSIFIQASVLPRSISSLLPINYLKIALLPRLQPYRKQLKEAYSSMQSLFRKPLHESESRSSALEERAYFRFLEQMRREIERIILPFSKIEQLNDSGNSAPLPSYQEARTAKQRNLHRILTELKPYSVLDIGSNTGWYSKLAASLGSQVVAFDTDESCITQLYDEARNNDLAILPLVMDFTKPTPSRGLASHWAIAATERFQCDMVLALALVHHIVLERRLNFDQIVEGLALFSKRWVVVEFVPREDQDMGQHWFPRLSWYTLDNFIDALKKRFHNVSILPSHPEPRVLLLCEK